MRILLNVSSVGHNDYKLMVHSCWRLTPGLRTTTTPASWLKLVSRLLTAPPASSVARPAVDTVRESWPSTDTLYSHTSVLYEPKVGSIKIGPGNETNGTSVHNLRMYCEAQARVGKDRQGMAPKAKGLKA